MDAEEREKLGRKRLQSVLGRHVIANARTLEQKIADAGPNPQRIHPHILTPIRREMEEEGLIVRQDAGGNTWYSLGNTLPYLKAARLQIQVAAFSGISNRHVILRTGQALEIATYRAMLTSGIDEFFGRFSDLEEHDDSKLYKKEEPPQHIGRNQLKDGSNLDFIVRHPHAGYLGLECKNVREWLYPNRAEVIEMVRKCVALDCVPVLIARRIPFVTFKIFQQCGVIIHETFNQIMATADTAAAEKAKDKDILGYHDIRVGNEPNPRLMKFIGTNMMAVAEEAREKFDAHKDLLEEFGSGELSYKALAAKVRRRAAGQNEAWDEPPDEPEWEFPF